METVESAAACESERRCTTRLSNGLAAMLYVMLEGALVSDVLEQFHESRQALEDVEHGNGEEELVQLANKLAASDSGMLAGLSNATRKCRYDESRGIAVEEEPVACAPSWTHLDATLRAQIGAQFEGNKTMTPDGLEQMARIIAVSAPKLAS